MSNKENRIKSLPDVFMLSSGFQFKYVQDISNQTMFNFKVGMAGGHKRLAQQTNMKNLWINI